ncbi:MAG: DUF1508 domain-containing protein [Proteobacteria bacterium]|nr:DUF1508 domain-containing protein [Pseudomonadota bacterium]
MIRWRLLAHNNEIIADSGEGYKNRLDCIHGLELVRAVNTDLPIVFKKK